MGICPLLLVTWIAVLTAVVSSCTDSTLDVRGNTSLECTAEDFFVTVTLVGDGPYGTIWILNIICQGYDEEVKVLTDGETWRLGIIRSVNLSSASYQSGNCTLYGCYEAGNFYLLPNSSCIINNFQEHMTVSSTMDLLATSSSEISDGFVQEQATVSSTMDHLTTSSSENKSNPDLLVIILAVAAPSAVLTTFVFLLMLVWILLNFYRVWRGKECRSCNLAYGADIIVEKFDPDFNPVEISDTTSNFSPTESSVQSIFTEELSTKTCTNTDYCDFGECNSTNSYFACSETD